MPLPTTRAAALLLALGLAVGLLAAGSPALAALLAAVDAALLAAAALDAALAPRAGWFRTARRMREPLSAFATNRVELRLENTGPRTARLELADAPPAGFDARGHRSHARLPPGAAFDLAYEVVPRARGEAAFGDLYLHVTGPLGLASRPLRLPLARTVRVYPDLRALAALPGAEAAEPGRRRTRGHREGREFEALRPYLDGDDVRSVDWKATARRGSPVVRSWQPERNQTLWLLVDEGRHLSARLRDGRTKLDHAVDAALALARAAAIRGDRAGAVLFGAEVERVVAPGSGRSQLGPLAEALHAALARVEESDYGAAFDALGARQRRRALVVLFTDLADPDSSALLLARAALLRRRHLVLVAAVSDSEIAEAARLRPSVPEEAYARIAAERILDEREAATARLAAAGVRVLSAPARELSAAVVGGYLEVKARGEL